MDRSRIIDVARNVAVVPCERAKNSTVGLAKIHGRTLPVIDLAGMLGVARRPTTSKTRLIVAKTEWGDTAFIVDSVVASNAARTVCRTLAAVEPIEPKRSESASGRIRSNSHAV